MAAGLFVNYAQTDASHRALPQITKISVETPADSYSNLIRSPNVIWNWTRNLFRLARNYLLSVLDNTGLPQWEPVYWDVGYCKPKTGDFDDFCLQRQEGLGNLIWSRCPCSRSKPWFKNHWVISNVLYCVALVAPAHVICAIRRMLAVLPKTCINVTSAQGQITWKQIASWTWVLFPELTWTC